MSNSDTIAAIATPAGEGGISVIRISGFDAIPLADRVFRPAGTRVDALRSVGSHTVHYGHVVRGGRVVDEVLATVFRAPRTFTREDVVELSCHGGPRVTAWVLEAVLESGARLAAPGEFTQRAFLNGRIDLAQAEAVSDLIHARTRRAAAAAAEQLAGGLSRRVEPIRGELMRVLAHLEAYVDFPEEDIQPETGLALVRRLEVAGESLRALLKTAGEGRILRQGLRTVIVGRPNAGKSSLLNQLLSHERAIVSPIAGTTRDTLEEAVEIGGIALVLVDTAGLREAGDVLEAEGIRRSRAAMEGADLVVLVVDGSAPLTAEDDALFAETAPFRRVVVSNKSDLPQESRFAVGVEPVRISCRTGEGLAELQAALLASVGVQPGDAEHGGVAVNARHADALRRALVALEATVTALRGNLSPDLVALDLRIATSCVGEISGRTSTEDLLDLVFSQFCLGK